MAAGHHRQPAPADMHGSAAVAPHPRQLSADWSSRAILPAQLGAPRVPFLDRTFLE